MITQLLNHRSPLMRLIQMTTVFLWLWNGLQPNTTVSATYQFTLGMVYTEVFILIICALIPWYGKKYKGLGIEDHFNKMTIPMTYLVLIDQLLRFFSIFSTGWNFFLIIIFTLLIVIHGILIRYHFKDKDKTPPSYFGANLYLQDTVGDQDKIL